MRRALALAGAAAFAGGLFASAPASAINCPDGTEYRTITVAGVTRGYCSPVVHCDPAACFPGSPE